MNEFTNSFHDLPARVHRLATVVRPLIGLPTDTDNGGREIVDEDFVRYARRVHRIAPMLNGLCGKNTAADITDEAAKMARRWHLRNTLRQARQQAIWQDTSCHLHQAGIAHWALKGQALATPLYSDPAARWAKDVDILVAPEQASDAASALRAAGYRNVALAGNAASAGDAGASRNVPAWRDRWHMALHKDRSLRDPRFDQIIELHQRVFYAEPKGFSDAVRRLQPSGEQIGIETPLGILYVIIHGALAHWARLKWLIDLSLLVRRMDRPCYDAVAALAGEYGCEAALHSSVLWGEAVFPQSLDPELKQHAAKAMDADPQVASLYRRFSAMTYFRDTEALPRRSLSWVRPDFPTAAWHVFPHSSMRAWLCGYVPVAALARMISR